MKKIWILILTVAMFAAMTGSAWADIVDVTNTYTSSSHCGFEYHPFGDDTWSHTDNCVDWTCGCPVCKETRQAASPCFDAAGNNTHTGSCTYILCSCKDCMDERSKASPCNNATYLYFDLLHKEDCTYALCSCYGCAAKNIAAGGGTGFAAVQPNASQTETANTPTPGGNTSGITLNINSQTVTPDAAPYMVEINGGGYTMVPLRLISEQLGAQVDYNDATRGITITLGDKVIKLTIGRADKAAGLDVAPVEKNDRTYVPLRYVSEQLGAQVDYDAQTLTITIN